MRKGDRLVVTPGEFTGWDLWLCGDGQTEHRQFIPTDAELFQQPKLTFALPAKFVHCAPSWILSSDPSVIASAVELQPEGLGISVRMSPVISWSIVHQEPARSLVSVAILSSELPSTWLASTNESYDLAARYLPLPENSLILWKEHGKLCVAVTWLRSLLYFQNLGAESLTPQTIQDLICIRSSLEMRRTIDSLKSIVLWCEIPEAEKKSLQTRLQLPVQTAKKPTPILPSEPWRLTPNSVTLAKHRSRHSTLRNRLLILAAFLYIAIAAGLLARLLYTQSQVTQLQTWMDVHQADIDSVLKAKETWTALNLVVDQDHYPMEDLLHCQKAIPNTDFHLTLFQQTDGNLIIKGEGKGSVTASLLAPKLEQDPLFANYKWEVFPVNPLPNDSASVEIHSTSPTSPDALTNP